MVNTRDNVERQTIETYEKILHIIALCQLARRRRGRQCRQRQLQPAMPQSWAKL